MSKKNFLPFSTSIKDLLASNAKLRLESVMKHFGNFKLDISNFQILLLLSSLKGPSYPGLKQQLAWGNGNENPWTSGDEFGVGDLPVISLYDTFVATGAFAKRKHEQLRFQEVIDFLMKFVRNEEISHLFYMSVLMNNDETRQIQSQYQYLLVKKLAEFCPQFGACNGDQALCYLKNLFTEFMDLSKRYLSDFSISEENEASTSRNCQSNL